MTYAPDHAVIATPLGRVRIEGDTQQLTAIRIGTDDPLCAGIEEPVRAAADQLSRWFAGKITGFDLPLAPAATERGRTLRAGLVAVDYGETTSYGELARRLASGARAIGQLCARNRFPIVVPCHRVIGAAGSLGQYSAGDGLPAKRWLIEHEARHRR